MADDVDSRHKMRARIFAWTARVMADPEIAPSASNVAWALAEHADGNGVAWPKIAEIGEATGTSPRRIPPHLEALRQRGYLQIEDRRHLHGPSWYWLAIDGKPLGDPRSPPTLAADQRRGVIRADSPKRPERHDGSVTSDRHDDVVMSTEHLDMTDSAVRHDGSGRPDMTDPSCPPCTPYKEDPPSRSSERSSDRTRARAPELGGESPTEAPGGGSPTGPARGPTGTPDHRNGVPDAVPDAVQNAGAPPAGPIRSVGVASAHAPRDPLRLTGQPNPEHVEYAARTFAAAYREARKCAWLGPRDLESLVRGAPMGAHRSHRDHIDALVGWAEDAPDVRAAIGAAITGFFGDTYAKSTAFSLALLAKEPGRYARPPAPSGFMPPAPASAFEDTPLTPELFRKRTDDDVIHAKTTGRYDDRTPLAGAEREDVAALRQAQKREADPDVIPGEPTFWMVQNARRELERLHVDVGGAPIGAEDAPHLEAVARVCAMRLEPIAAANRLMQRTPGLSWELRARRAARELSIATEHARAEARATG